MPIDNHKDRRARIDQQTLEEILNTAAVSAPKSA
jgi:hypothetical protein